MPRKRKGRQKPTQSYILRYKTSKGPEAVALYNQTGRTAAKWQEYLLKDILGMNKKGLWVHSKFGYSVPRRNGKNEVVAIREMYGLVELGEHIMHTAHRTTTSHAAWERLMNLLKNANIPITSAYRASGKEHIELENGGKIEFRTRTSKGGLGEGFDLLVIDEAQEYQDDQESTLKYVVSDSANPQTIFCGTPPTPISSGTVFQRLRNDTLRGEMKNTGWAEWSVEDETDPNDVAAWYETNPSLGTILTERKIQDEIGSDIIDFNIQRLGLWIKYNQKSAISKAEWESLKVERVPELAGKIFVGIKYSKDGGSVSMSIAVKTVEEGVIFVEALDCVPRREGDNWILELLASMDISRVVIDGASGQQILAAEMRAERMKKPILPTVREVIVANSVFEKGLYAKQICHMDQPSLTQSVSNCEHRAIGTNGGFGYKSIRDDVDITLLDSMILAYWAAIETKENKKQKVSY